MLSYGLHCPDQGLRRRALRLVASGLGLLGRHRVPIPDLLIAGCAQQHQAAILHLDRHYDTLAEVLAFEAVRLPA
jgi:predicted nucleic acid-binding protein